MIVMKFGGTSVEDATAIRRLTAIVRKQIHRRPLVAVSAMGKTTNGLLECARLAAEDNLTEALRKLESIALHHYDAISELAPAEEVESLKMALEERFDGIRIALHEIAEIGEVSSEYSDAVSANGELLSSKVVAAAFRGDGIDGRWIDIRQAMKTNAEFTRAAVDFTATDPLLKDLFASALAEGGVPVTQGFIGSTGDGRTTTIGRGGSDYSAAIIGAALDAEEIQIWTDVDGIMTTDPGIVPESAKVRIISFAEASELAYFGARVLHPSTLLPAMKNDIPVRVCNSRRDEVEGTAIVRTAPQSRALAKAIAFKRGITIVNVASDRMLMAYGFLAKIFEVFARHETPVDMVATSEVSVSMTLDDTRNLEAILTDLRALGEVKVETDQALICVVGDRLKYTPGLAAKIFSGLSDINVSMISHGASAINVSFIVDGDDVERAVRALHQTLFEILDDETFEMSRK